MPIDRGRTIISRNPEITAYEIAVANGFVGTEAQWLESLIATPTYKVYSALLTQAGTDAPVATVLENTLGGNIVWTRDDIGSYIGTLVGAFTENKTWCSATKAAIVTGASNIDISRDNSDSILILNYLPTDTSYDNLNVSIEIRVYP